MSPMFIELRSSAEVTSDFFPPAFSLSSSPVILQPMHQQIPSPRPSSTINEPTEECHFSTALNFSFVTGYIPRHEQFSKSAVQIQPSPLAMVNGQWCTGPSSNTKRKQLTMPKSFPHTTWLRVERCFRTQRQQTSVWLPACCEILRMRVCSADSFLPHARTHKRMTRVSSAKHELRNIFWLQIPGTCQLDAATLGPWAAKRSQKTWCWQLWIGYSQWCTSRMCN